MNVDISLPNNIQVTKRVNTSQVNKLLNDTLDYLDLIDIYRAFHLKVAEYILLKYTEGILQNKSHTETQSKPW